MAERHLDLFRKYFWRQDKDGDGELSRAEFMKMSQSMGLKLSVQEINNLFKKADKDNSERISFKEFAQVFVGQKRTATPNEERMRQVFKQADQNRNGTLTRSECLAAMKRLGHVMDDRGLSRVMGVMDKDESGGISFEEFRRFMAL